MARLPAIRPARPTPPGRTHRSTRSRLAVTLVVAVSALAGTATVLAPPASAAPPAIDYNFDFIGQDRATGGTFGGGSVAGFRRGTGTGHGPYTEELSFRYIPVLSNPVGFDIRHTAGPCTGRSDRYQTLGVVADKPPSWSGTYPFSRDENNCLREVRPVGDLDQAGQSSVDPAKMPAVLTVTPAETGAPLAQVIGYSGDWHWPSSPPVATLESCNRVAQNCRVRLRERDLEYSASSVVKLILKGFKRQDCSSCEPYVPPAPQNEIVLAEQEFSGPDTTLTVPFDPNVLPQSNNILAVGKEPAYSTVLTELDDFTGQGKGFRAEVEVQVLDVDAYNNDGQFVPVTSGPISDPPPPPAAPTVGPKDRSGPPLGFRPMPGTPPRRINVTEPPGPVDPTPVVGQPDVLPDPPKPPEQLPVTGLLNRCSVESCEVTDLRFPGPIGRVRLVDATDGTFFGDADVSGTAGRIYFPADSPAKPGALVRAEGFDPRIGEWVPLANTIPVGTPNILPGYTSAMRCTADNPTLSPRGTCKATIVDGDAPGKPLNVCLYAVALPGRADSRKVGCNPTDAAGFVQFPDHGMAAATEFYVEVEDALPKSSFDTVQRVVVLTGATLTPRFGRN